MTKSSTLTLAPTTLDAEAVANKAVAEAPAGATMEQLEATITNALRRTLDVEAARQPLVIEPLLVTVKQASEALQTSTRTVWKMVADGRINAVHLGDLCRIPLSELKRLATAGA